MKGVIKSIIIDDVESMRVVLKKLLGNFERIVVSGEAADFEEALDVINEEKPELLFLDIDLNGLTSMDLINEIRYQPKPMVIFITSHTDFALRAFEVNAVDYILKPISLERLTKAIEKVTNKWEDINNNGGAIASLNSEQPFGVDHIVLLNFDDKFCFVRVRDITFIEAYGNYTKIHTKDGRMSITYNSIKNWMARLPEEMFVQIHRSTIINLTDVGRVEKWTNDTGRLFLQGKDTTPFEVSRSYFFDIKKRFKM